MNILFVADLVAHVSLAVGMSIMSAIAIISAKSKLIESFKILNPVLLIRGTCYAIIAIWQITCFIGDLKPEVNIINDISVYLSVLAGLTSALTGVLIITIKDDLMTCFSQHNITQQIKGGDKI